MEGANDVGQRAASLGIKGGGLSLGSSASNNPTEHKAVGGRLKGKGKGIGMASQQHKGGVGEEAICRLLAIKPK